MRGCTSPPRRLKARGGYLDDDGAEDRSLAYQRLVRELLGPSGGEGWSA
jgi:hypothetical protein